MLRVGTSGWQYRDWRGAFYPTGLATTHWLGALRREAFPTVEANSPFYRLPDPGDVRAVGGAHPGRSSRFAVKASRYLTHVRRLVDPADPVATFVERAAGWARSSGRSCCNCHRRCGPTWPASSATLRRSHPISEWSSSPATSRGTSTRSTARSRPATPPCALGPQRPAGPHGPHRKLVLPPPPRGTTHAPPGYGRRALDSWVQRLVTIWGEQADGYVCFSNGAGARGPRCSDLHPPGPPSRRTGPRPEHRPALKAATPPERWKSTRHNSLPSASRNIRA